MGFNGTLFAYGQTGTGKTYTMVGPHLSLSHLTDENYTQHGILAASLIHIYSAIEQDPEYTYDVSISFIQIYMEMIQDLLNPNNTDVKIREDASSKVFVSGASWIPSGSIKQALNIFSVGEKNRAVAFTSLNAHSSRSHAVFMIKLEKRRKYNQSQLEEIEKNGSYSSIDKSIITSTLYLVDLAGSERVKKTKATASRLEEARKINFSLSALGK